MYRDDRHGPKRIAFGYSGISKSDADKMPRYAFAEYHGVQGSG